MTSNIREIPEVQGLDSGQSMIRIPHETDVPMTPRVRSLVDTAAFRRLAQVSQLGLVSLVYPAAHHTRFEHSLGVYRMALLWLRRLSYVPRFADTIKMADAERFIIAALLHDLGHWPLCHPIEDMKLPGVPHHERFAHTFLTEGEVADVLRDRWQIDPDSIVAVLSEEPDDTSTQLLQSMLSGPIDIDKMDYLARDSLHAGVPYGSNWDRSRLLASLTLDAAGSGLAITEKGRTAAEMMVFARYVMFSEVYWHHAVRSATAMFQRAFYLLHEDLDLDELFRQGEHEMITSLRDAGGTAPAGQLLNGLFGTRRQLYKRAGEFSTLQEEELYRKLARRPYPWLAACGDALANELSRYLGQRVAPHEVLLDAPPVKLEVQFNVDVFYRKESTYRPLAEVSPVVKTLAEKQFDDYVKKVRVFVHPRLVEQMPNAATLAAAIHAAVDQTDGS